MVSSRALRMTAFAPLAQTGSAVSVDVEAVLRCRFLMEWRP